MKSAQQLVYGEQIGWINPNVVDQPENAQFLRQVVRLRWQLRRYFHAGEMLRPPGLKGEHSASASRLAMGQRVVGGNRRSADRLLAVAARGVGRRYLCQCDGSTTAGHVVV